MPEEQESNLKASGTKMVSCDIKYDLELMGWNMQKHQDGLVSIFLNI